MIRIVAATASAALCLLLPSCAAGGGDEGGMKDLLELREAAVDAGLTCDDWKRKDETTGACTDQSVLQVFKDKAAREKSVAKTVKSWARFPDITFTFLVDDNWMINSDQAPWRNPLRLVRS